MCRSLPSSNASLPTANGGGSYEHSVRSGRKRIWRLANENAVALLTGLRDSERPRSCEGDPGRRFPGKTFKLTRALPTRGAVRKTKIRATNACRVVAATMASLALRFQMHRKTAGWRVVVVATGSLIVASCGSADTVDPGAAAGTEAGWHAMPAPPIPARIAPALAARDDDVLLFGGHDATVDDGQLVTSGAAYDSETATWQPIAGPREGAVGAAHAIASNEQWLLSGYLCSGENRSLSCPSDGAAFFALDGEDASWTPLPLPPAATILVPLGVVGGEVIYSIGYGDDASRGFGAYDTAAREWRLFDAPPLRVRGQSCLAGASVAALSYRFELSVTGEVTDQEPGVPNGTPNAPRAYVEASVSLTDASGRWTAPAPVGPALRSEAPFELACTPGHVIVFGADGLAVYDVTARRWLDEPASPPVPPRRRVYEFRRTTFVSGDRAFMWGDDAEGLSYDPAINEWRPFPAGAIDATQVAASQSGALLYVTRADGAANGSSMFRYVRGSGTSEKPFPTDVRYDQRIL